MNGIHYIVLVKKLKLNKGIKMDYRIRLQDAKSKLNVLYNKIESLYDKDYYIDKENREEFQLLNKASRRQIEVIDNLENLIKLEDTLRDNEVLVDRLLTEARETVFK